MGADYRASQHLPGSARLVQERESAAREGSVGATSWPVGAPARHASGASAGYASGASACYASGASAGHAYPETGLDSYQPLSTS